MEETVSVLIWECWLWEDTMDMTDWARLLLAGSVESGAEGRSREVRYGFCELTEEQSNLPVLTQRGPQWPHHSLTNKGLGLKFSKVLLLYILGLRTQPREQGSACP